ncbi:multicopper oxidase family protein [Saccharopolyspora halophila]
MRGGRPAAGRAGQPAARSVPPCTGTGWPSANDMDGVPNLTQDPVRPGSTKTYEFTVPDPGTYWSHPHVGVQRAHGLHAPLIVEDRHERGDYDAEFVVVLDDWLDGMAAAPEQVRGTLRAAKGMHPGYRTDVEEGRIEDRSGTWEYDVPEALAEPPAGVEPEPPQARLKRQVDYPAYLINGRLPTDPQTFTGNGRARIRLINASGSTVFRVALGEHRLTVTHTDGFPVEPVEVDTLQLGSGERYDVVTDLKSGVFPLVGVAEGKKAQAFAVVRTSKAGSAPQPTAQPGGLGGELLWLTDLRATAEVDTGSGTAGKTGTLYLTGDMMRFGWSINAKAYDPDRPFTSVEPLDIREGEPVRLDFVNQGNMYHPVHLHGHTFAVREIADIAGGAPTRLPRGTRKDTVMVAPGRRVGVDFTADNPGQWLVHCHNAYHVATGMASLVSYVR